MKKDQNKSKLGLKREAIKVLGAKTGVKAGLVNPTMECSAISCHGECVSFKLACRQ